MTPQEYTDFKAMPEVKSPSLEQEQEVIQYLREQEEKKSELDKFKERVYNEIEFLWNEHSKLLQKVDLNATRTNENNQKLLECLAQLIIKANDKPC